MATKYDKIIGHLNSIDIKLSDINGHLNKINGTVARNISDIGEDRKKISSLEKENKEQNKEIWKLVGGIGFLFSIIMVVVNYIFRFV